MQARIVARFLNGLHDCELVYVNGIQFGPIREFKSDFLSPEIAEILYDEFDMKYPNTHSWHITAEKIPSV